MTIRISAGNLWEIAEKLSVSHDVAHRIHVDTYTASGNVDEPNDPDRVQNTLRLIGERLGRAQIEALRVAGRIAQPGFDAVLLYIQAEADKPTVIYDVETDDYYIDTLDNYRKMVAA